MIALNGKPSSKPNRSSNAAKHCWSQQAEYRFLFFGVQCQPFTWANMLAGPSESSQNPDTTEGAHGSNCYNSKRS